MVGYRLQRARFERCASGFRSCITARPRNPLSIQPKHMLGKLVHFASNLMVVFAAILVSMLSVDILGYFFLPPQYTEALPGYRLGDNHLAMGYIKKVILGGTHNSGLTSRLMPAAQMSSTGGIFDFFEQHWVFR